MERGILANCSAGRKAGNRTALLRRKVIGIIAGLSGTKKKTEMELLGKPPLRRGKEGSIRGNIESIRRSFKIRQKVCWVPKGRANPQRKLVGKTPRSLLYDNAM